eukprot:620321-Rhodomonas_salina.1
MAIWGLGNSYVSCLHTSTAYCNFLRVGKLVIGVIGLCEIKSDFWSHPPNSWYTTQSRFGFSHLIPRRSPTN